MTFISYLCIYQDTAASRVGNSDAILSIPGFLIPFFCVFHSIFSKVNFKHEGFLSQTKRSSPFPCGLSMGIGNLGNKTMDSFKNLSLLHSFRGKSLKF